MTHPVQAYTWREPANCLPPREVLNALGAPLHVKQARIVVFAETRQAAYGILEKLNMAPRHHLSLAPTAGLDVRAITAQGDAKLGDVYAQYNGNVVWVTQDDDGNLITVPYSFTALPPKEAVPDGPFDEPVITDAMIDAFSREFWGDRLVQSGQVSSPQLIRRALIAALRAQKDES